MALAASRITLSASQVVALGGASSSRGGSWVPAWSAATASVGSRGNPGGGPTGGRGPSSAAGSMRGTVPSWSRAGGKGRRVHWLGGHVMVRPPWSFHVRWRLVLYIIFAVLGARAAWAAGVSFSADRGGAPDKAGVCG